ncbi:acylphosphatase-like [Juglans microcarpa x Juglans regia]|uniref:acylphosphatase-like n=1 Tax=Juglans microcarpa x Juglans regia TaxID=2249226 RepID=UPI001B7E1993|nr:acylphosphatase-like [Juglans microcarpa x Juglans regia]
MNNNAYCTPRFAHFHHPHYHPAYPLLSLCLTVLLPRPPLYSLLRPHSPHFRHSLPLMTNPQAATEDSTQPSTRTVRVVVKGRVQGVFYRNWTVENAVQLGLKGWVRNKRDGSVEALFSGNPDTVQEMEQRCRRGPPDAMVTGLQVFPTSDDPGSGFERKRTE